jgi:hypothetical protein
VALLKAGIACAVRHGSFLGILDAGASQLMVLVVTLSLLLAPLLFALQDRVLDPWLHKRTEPEYDTIDTPGNPVIIAGYGRVGQIVSRVLRMCGVAFTAIEASYQQVDFVRRFGNKVYYGDASRLELLQAASDQARLFVLAITTPRHRKTAEVVQAFSGADDARARNRYASGCAIWVCADLATRSGRLTWPGALVALV